MLFSEDISVFSLRATRGVRQETRRFSAQTFQSLFRLGSACLCPGDVFLFSVRLAEKQEVRAYRRARWKQARNRAVHTDFVRILSLGS